MEHLIYPLISAANSFPVIVILIVVVGLVFFLRQRKGQEIDIPPLDLLDAKKLDDMVSKQIEEVLKPMLQSKGYTQEQIKEILTRTSLSEKTFRR